MALIDYIPVILFILVCLLLVKNLRNKMNKISFYLFVIGACLVSCAGFFKATYKLLYALNIGDYLWMSNQFFSNQSLGLLITGIGLVTGVVRLKKSNAYSFLPTMVLVGLMVIGVAAIDSGLCFLANRMKKRNAMICFIVNFFAILIMGYLSSKDFNQPFMNWLAQGTNVVGQLLLYVGVRILDKAGLKDI